MKECTMFCPHIEIYVILRIINEENKRKTRFVHVSVTTLLLKPIYFSLFIQELNDLNKLIYIVFISFHIDQEKKYEVRETVS